MPPDQQDRYALVRKGPDGGSEWVSRDQLAADPATTAPQGEKVRVGEYEISAEELGAMMQRQAAEDLRKAQIPPTSADYKLSLPETLTLPGNAQYQFDEAGNKASFDAVRAWAHGRGMSQSEFSEMMGLFASHEAAREAKIAESAKAERAKIGVNGAQRIDAIATWIRSEVGDSDARPILATLATAAHAVDVQGHQSGHRAVLASPS